MTFALSFFRPQKQVFFYPKTLFWALFSVFWNWKMEKCAIKGGREGRDLTPNGTSHELFPLFGALPSLIYWTSDVLKTWQMWPWLTRILSTSQSSSKVYVGKHHWCLNFGQDFEAEFCRDSELNFDRDQCENLWYNLKAVILVKALNPWICSDFGNASIDDYIAVWRKSWRTHLNELEISNKTFSELVHQHHPDLHSVRLHILLLLHPGFCPDCVMFGK